MERRNSPGPPARRHLRPLRRSRRRSDEDGPRRLGRPVALHVRNGLALPVWAGGRQAPGAANEEFPFHAEAWFDRQAWEQMRKDNAPVFAFPQGSESQAVFILRDGQLEQIGVQQFPGLEIRTRRTIRPQHRILRELADVCGADRLDVRRRGLAAVMEAHQHARRLALGDAAAARNTTALAPAGWCSPPSSAA